MFCPFKVIYDFKPLQVNQKTILPTMLEYNRLLKKFLTVFAGSLTYSDYGKVTSVYINPWFDFT